MRREAIERAADPQHRSSCTMTRERSSALFDRASQHLVGGVNSPVRAFRGVGGNPLFIDRANGAHLFDADGNQYIDYVLSWGPGILGHAPGSVVKAVAEQAALGTSFGAPCELEIDLAELVKKHVPSVEKLRFVSSGTEATMSALRLARGVTGRDGIVKCEGCYHGHADSLLVKAGSGVSTLGLPDSPGVPADLAKHTFNVPFNDADALEKLFAETGDQLSCVILEPVAGNMGCVPPQEGYLEKVRKICSDNGALLIFDEVMTGFRVSLGGAQRRYNVKPDITCFGKVIGGGLPVGAFGASAEIMSHLAPEGPIYQAGTLSGNPLAMAAGKATLEALNDDLYEELSAKTQRLAEGIARAARDAGIDAVHTAEGTMFSVFLLPEVPKNFDDVKKADTALFSRFFWQMLDRSIYLAPSAFEAGFTSVEHSDADFDRTIAAAAEAFVAAKDA
jgi:glutamate-1-semialdehyde 2,1-aminomutase